MSNNEKEYRWTRKEIELCNRALCALLTHFTHNRFKPVHIISIYNMFATVKLCSRIIRNYLKKNRTQNYVAVSKPYLSKDKILKRKRRALEHVKWSTELWNSAVFSDKSWFTIRNTVPKFREWHRSGTRFDFSNAILTFKSGYTSLSALSAFSEK